MKRGLFNFKLNYRFYATTFSATTATEGDWLRYIPRYFVEEWIETPFCFYLLRFLITIYSRIIAWILKEKFGYRLLLLWNAWGRCLRASSHKKKRIKNKIHRIWWILFLILFKIRSRKLQNKNRFFWKKESTYTSTLKPPIYFIRWMRNRPQWAMV